MEGRSAGDGAIPGRSASGGRWLAQVYITRVRTVAWRQASKRHSPRKPRRLRTLRATGGRGQSSARSQAQQQRSRPQAIRGAQATLNLGVHRTPPHQGKVPGWEPGAGRLEGRVGWRGDRRRVAGELRDGSGLPRVTHTPFNKPGRPGAIWAECSCRVSGDAAPQALGSPK